jgi:hypothetical protein
MDLDQQLHNVTEAIKLQKKRLGMSSRAADTGLLKAHLKKRYGVTVSRKDYSGPQISDQAIS